jgi:hypothetical protein
MAITLAKNAGFAWIFVMAFKASCPENFHLDIAMSGMKMDSWIERSTPFHTDSISV